MNIKQSGDSSRQQVHEEGELAEDSPCTSACTRPDDAEEATQEPPMLQPEEGATTSNSSPDDQKSAEAPEAEEDANDSDVIVLTKPPLLPLAGRKRELSEVTIDEEAQQDEPTAKRQKLNEDPEQDASEDVDQKMDKKHADVLIGAINQSEKVSSNDLETEPAAQDKKKCKPKKKVMFAEDLEQVKFFMAADAPSDPSLTIEQVQSVQRVIDDNNYGMNQMSSFFGASAQLKKELQQVREKI